MPETEVKKHLRFQEELEFVQSLANPFYLHHLAQGGYLEDDRFLAYLSYLSYWREPQYARFLVYPHALRYLELLEHPDFCAKLKHLEFVHECHDRQRAHWLYWRESRPVVSAGQSDPTQQQHSPSVKPYAV
ncbi:mediator of RNA polymerase II transcription subunit 31 [Piptocephalis cylindrospora]|uniref:Mediator of RNA polymerase II transcription subunit 31 n=1 Tax=Piptocephalis cylindrospora TaxID=1907219 RepID=A0A4P9Y127_9FUNG|nr:mediator of RNA polymerase II transcription subunit 31 [Piptocephalis cylindrospora]|eukprot:RKP12453.1 mediator of RNA polymerase II transcription subunit 31 [Piptocephalis cylindrospora]